ncbi:MAG: uracil-DNA glycosylase family protein [Bacteroidales bacterium]|nr:uracil-DNA glycosylase family protein [Bacteroidales bacterium]
MGKEAESTIAVEQHPLQPFLPPNATVLFLGSFPPPRTRWSMNFFYPNIQNDMWRIWGLIFFNDPNYFVLPSLKKFDYQKIVDFCNTYGLAFFDTAFAVKRLQENASDKFLEVVQPTNIEALLSQIPHCQAIVTTGEKATDVLVTNYNCAKPKIGTFENIYINSRFYKLYRMPSSSRAYPLPLSKKADAYKVLVPFFHSK